MKIRCLLQGFYVFIFCLILLLLLGGFVLLNDYGDCCLTNILLGAAFVVPILSGAKAAFLARHGGLLHGGCLGLLEFFCCLLVIIWFAPQYMELVWVAMFLVIFGLCGAFGGLCGVNMRVVREKLDSKHKK